MDKVTALGIVENMSVDEIAHSIYLATVRGVSGANQNGGMGFNLSAIAEVYNIKGTVNDPFAAKTKITNRYRGMGVTEDMIYNVVAQHPSGFFGSSPSFDELLGVVYSGRRNPQRVSEPNAGTEWNRDSYAQNQNQFDLEDKIMGVVGIGTFVVLKFFLGWGWIISILLASLAAGVVLYLLFGKR